MFVIPLHTNLQMTNYTVSLVMIVKPSAKYRINAAAMLLLHSAGSCVGKRRIFFQTCNNTLFYVCIVSNGIIACTAQVLALVTLL
jgi:hypothetical protein